LLVTGFCLSEVAVMKNWGCQQGSESQEKGRTWFSM
jgi:hypothetical protein